MLGKVQSIPMRAHQNFDVGASISNRIAWMAAAIIAAISAFFFLPFESASILTLGAGALASLFSCSNSSNQSRSWFRWPVPDFRLPRGLVAVQPAVLVAQSGRRVIPEQGDRPVNIQAQNLRIVHSPAQKGRNTVVGKS